MNTSRNHKRESNGRKTNEVSEHAAATCPSCQTHLFRDAKFCHACGFSLNGTTKRYRQWNFGMIAIFGVVVIGVVAITMTAIVVERRPARAPAFDAAPVASGSTSRQPPDLSTMSPRQAADRLYNRVMRAHERADTAEVTRFAPMALQAYQRVGLLDADAHYHIAGIHLAVGDVESARQQLALIRQLVPDHLLGFSLEHVIASLVSDSDGMARAYTGFAAAYGAEMRAGRPEYEGHRTHIEQFRASGLQNAASSKSASIASLDPSTSLFVKHCSQCHGESAQGTDKGPPLVHRLYRPSHHSDEAFSRAVRKGAQAHHWSFGDMPPISGVSDTGVKQIIAHVRKLQAAGGIE